MKFVTAFLSDPYVRSFDETFLQAFLQAELFPLAKHVARTVCKQHNLLNDATNILILKRPTTEQFCVV